MEEDQIDQAIKSLENIPEAKATLSALKKVYRSALKGTTSDANEESEPGSTGEIPAAEGKPLAVDLISAGRTYQPIGETDPELERLKLALEEILQKEAQKRKGASKDKIEKSAEGLIRDLLVSAELCKEEKLAEYRDGTNATNRKRILGVSEKINEALTDTIQALSADNLDDYTLRLIALAMKPDIRRDLPLLEQNERETRQVAEHWITDLTSRLKYLSKITEALSTGIKESIKQKNRLTQHGLGSVAYVIAKDFRKNGIKPTSSPGSIYHQIVERVFSFLGVPERKNLELYLSYGIKKKG